MNSEISGLARKNNPMDKETGDYTQKKHLKGRKLGMAGFALFAVGFAFQIIGVIIGI